MRVHSYHKCQNFHCSWICCMVISWGEQGWILWLDQLKQYWFLLERCLTDILPHYLLFPSINALLRPNTPNGKIHRIFQRSSSTKVSVWDKKSKSREGEQLHRENYAKVKNFFFDFVSRAGLRFCLWLCLCLLYESILPNSTISNLWYVAEQPQNGSPAAAFPWLTGITS